MPQEPLDIVGLITALLAFLVSRDVAIAVGPYGAIVVLSCAGAALSLSGSDERMNNWRASWFVFIRVFLACALTVVIAETLQKFIPWLQPRWSLSPIAFAIGWIRDYDQVRSFLGHIIERFADKKIDDGK